MITYKQLGNNGRLGNMLFQIASTIGIAVKNEEVYSFPYFSYNKYLKNEIPHNILYTKNIYNELHFHYNDVVIKECDLRGYLQSEKYFIHCKDLIKYIFSLKDEYSEYLKTKYKEILSKPNCSIHIRRGDYVNLQNYHPVVPLEYYQKSIDIIGNVNYLVFSDDIDWCKENFKGDNFYFIQETEDILELFLQSYCENNIIANSSFSWWGAWLNNNENKKIIAPIKWFGINYSHDTKDLIPDEWIKI